MCTMCTAFPGSVRPFPGIDERLLGIVVDSQEWDVRFPGMCHNSQELTPTCMNPGNDFEGVVEKVPFGDHIPRIVGIIPGNSTNPGNEFQNKIAGLVVFCMRSQDCDTCSLNPGKNSQDCDSHSWEFDHQERNTGNETECNVQCSHEFGENSQEL